MLSFEGSEKKIELITKGVNFKRWPYEKIEKMVKTSGAVILSHISNENLSAYILSESSLFIWDDRLLMITCGKTQLSKTALYLLEEIKKEQLKCLIYERKNEYFPQVQFTDFHEDACLLNQKAEGLAWRFGNIDEHHLYLYHLKKHFMPTSSERTLELLMYDLPNSIKNMFEKKSSAQNEKTLANIFNKIFSGFQIDEHFFSPCGYSLNAIQDSTYYTIHITPEKTSPYISFETNMNPEKKEKEILSKVLEFFEPNSFDIISFQTKKNEDPISLNSFTRRSHFSQQLMCGFYLKYAHFFKTYKNPKMAQQINLQSS